MDPYADCALGTESLFRPGDRSGWCDCECGHDVIMTSAQMFSAEDVKRRRRLTGAGDSALPVRRSAAVGAVARQYRENYVCWNNLSCYRRIGVGDMEEGAAATGSRCQR